MPLLTTEAMPYLPRAWDGNHELTDSDIDIALGCAMDDLIHSLPMDEAAELYCDLDENHVAYAAALRKLVAEFRAMCAEK